MDDLALRLIAENKKTRSPTLDLGNCGLTEVPAEIGELIWLEELSFSKERWNGETWIKSRNYGKFNNLKQLNPSISPLSKVKRFVSKRPAPNVWSRLTNLKRLTVTTTSDRYINPWGFEVIKLSVADLSPLTRLTNLQSLSVVGTPVADLTPLAGLDKLQLLGIAGTQVADLAPLAGLDKLQSLDISSTPVAYLAPLSGLDSLQSLDIAGTQVADLAPLSGLSGLRWLNVSGTQVTEITPLDGLLQLEVLDISETQVNDLSPLMPLMELGIPVVWEPTKLVCQVPFNLGIPIGIDVTDCPLINPPAEVVRQGNEAILNYFRERQAQGVDHLFEAKLLIVGEGGSGKTSLLRRLYRPEEPLPEEDETTKGIDIHRYEFLLANGRYFRLNVWDFGGQEIYHATHQFFLTKRSLYVLLDDTRKDYKSVQDEGFKYWLEVVDQLSDHSPVLIFQNEKGGRSKTIDEAGIKSRFNVKDVYRGNLANLDSADKIKEAIEYFAHTLPHIGEELPARWVDIRTEIEKRAVEVPYIPQQEYFDLYKNHLEFDRVKALHLSRYFHDLGIFLHYQDDPLLARTVILQNEWATEAVFKMLDDEQVKARLGRFTSSDCKRVWQDSEYADMHPELLALMENFELCYRLTDTRPDTWLAPQLLPPSKPEKLADWERPGDLVLRYRYEFLPKGMISRLMVRQHRFVPRPELGWVTGVLFERDGSEVLTQIPSRGGEVVLRARGPERKELLSVISADLDALNDTFHGLSEKVSKWVPCVCKRCRDLSEPEFFEQKRLLQRKKDGKLKVECPSSYEDVDVRQMLDGIWVDRLPGWAEKEDKVKVFRSDSARTERTLKIFLASSAELRQDRDEFDLYFRQQNDRLREQGNYLQIVRWENFLDAMSESRLQDEYNKEVRDCDIFVSLFFRKTGKFTEEEFDTAHQQFLSTKKPLIYTFFKNAPIHTGEIDDEIMSLLQFKKKLDELGHFYTSYDNIEHLKRQFRDQLDKLLEESGDRKSL